MSIRKKKISDYPSANSLKGLWTLGYEAVNGFRKTCKVSLEFIYNIVKKAEDAADAVQKVAEQNEFLEEEDFDHLVETGKIDHDKTYFTYEEQQ